MNTSLSMIENERAACSAHAGNNMSETENEQKGD